MARVYTAGERAYIAQGKKTHLAAAGIFCAKEAAAKALGMGLYGLRPDEIEVVHDARGAPRLVLLGGALRRFPDAQFSLSISHADEYTVATCIAQLPAAE